MMKSAAEKKNLNSKIDLISIIYANVKNLLCSPLPLYHSYQVASKSDLTRERRNKLTKGLQMMAYDGSPSQWHH